MNNYRCKDCKWYKEFGSVCTYFYKRKNGLDVKCKYFKLKK